MRKHNKLLSSFIWRCVAILISVWFCVPSFAQTLPETETTPANSTSQTTPTQTQESAVDAQNPFEAADFLKMSNQADKDEITKDLEKFEKELEEVKKSYVGIAQELFLEIQAYDQARGVSPRTTLVDELKDENKIVADQALKTILEDYNDSSPESKSIVAHAQKYHDAFQKRWELEKKIDDLKSVRKAKGDIYEFITEDGQKIYFKRVEYAFQSVGDAVWGKYESVGETVTQGCMPLPAKIAETRSCIFCPLFLTIFNAAQNIATNSFGVLGAEMSKLILVGFAIFIAFTVLKYVSSLSKQDTPALMNDLLKQGFKIIVACVLLLNPDFIYGKLIGPVLNAGTELGGAFLYNGGSGFVEWCSVEKNITEQTEKMISGEYNGPTGEYEGEQKALNEGVIPAYIYTKIECFVRSVQAEISLSQSIGSTLMCVSRHEASDSKLLFIPIPDFSMLLQGFILWGMAIIMTIAFAFYLVDATVKLAVVGALMPIFIACWPFRQTVQYTQIGWQMLLNTFFVYTLMGLVITVNIELIIQGLTAGTGSIDNIKSVINGNDIDALRSILEIGFSGFLILIACCLFAFKMTGQAAEIAGQFAGGGGTSIAPQLGTLGLQAAKGVGFGTMKRVGSVMKAAGAAAKAGKFADSAKDKVGRALGLGKYGGKAGANQRNAQGGVQGATPQGSGASGANQNQPNPNQPNQPNPNQPNPPVSQQDREFGDALRQEALDQTALRNARQDVAAAQNDANAARGTPQEAAQLKKLQDAQLALQAAQSKANASKQNRENLENLLKNNPNSAYKDPQSLQNKKNFEQSAAALAAAQANRQANVARLQELDRILKSSTDSKTIAKAQQEKNKLSNENAKLDKYISDTKKYNDNLFEKLSNQVGTEEHQKRVDGVNKEIQYYEDNKAYYGNKSGRETYEESISPDKQQQEINSTVQKINENAAAQVAKDAEIAAKQAEIAKQMQLLDNERKMAQTATDKPSKDLYEQQAKERENLINRANQELNALQAQAQNIRNNTQRLNDIRLSLERELPNKQKQWAFYNKFMKPQGGANA